MVRLRLILYTQEIQHYEISIPHGTIKTPNRKFHPAAFYRISIPHGTIKTARGFAPFVNHTKFQFHMVRLRL